MKTLLLLLSFVGFVFTVSAQTPTTQVSPAPLATPAPANPNDMLIRYQEFLREETKLHREYTQSYYAGILTLITILGAAIGGMLTWLNWKSKKDMQEQINASFKAGFQTLLDEKLAQVDRLITDGKEKSTKQFEDIGKIILELSAKSKVISTEIRAELKKEAVYSVEELNGKKILWVDDHPGNNGYPVSVLEKAGVTVSIAPDTAEAIEALRTSTYDLIISDMGRRGHRSAGLDLLKECKKLNIDTPVIIYAPPQALATYGKQAMELGASTTTTVTGVLNLVQANLSNPD